MALMKIPEKHNLNVGYIASLFEKQGNIVIVSLISPYKDVRDEVRTMCQRFLEVYLSTDLDTCIARDPKGLYQKPSLVKSKILPASRPLRSTG